MRACALHDLERGKLFLASGDTSDALASLKKANEVLPNLKLRLVLLGLRYVPSLFIFLVRMRARPDSCRKVAGVFSWEAP